MNDNEKRLQATHPDYGRVASDWRMCRDFISGIKSLRAHDLECWKDRLATILNSAGKSSREPAREGFVDRVVACYIPPVAPRMTFIEYVLYLVRGHYYNVVADTKGDYLGQIFGKRPEITMPPGSDSLTLDADLAETPIEEYLETLVDEILSVGRVGVLVERPSIGGTILKGDAERMGIRPYCATYRAEDILDWARARQGPRMVTTYVKLRESVRRGDARDYNYRELRMDEGGYYQLEWTREKAIDDYACLRIDPRIGGADSGRPLAAIPFYPFSPHGGGIEIEAPPLMDLVDMALEHYQASVEYANARFMVASPTPGFYGFNSDEMDGIFLGGTGGIFATDAGAHAEFLELKGAGLEPLRQAILDIEARQSKLGSERLAAPKSAVESADALRIRAKGQSAGLADIALSASRIATQMMALACEWNGTPGEVEIELNTSYSEMTSNPQEIAALVAAREKNYITQADFNARLRETGILGTDRTDDEIAAELEHEAGQRSDAQAGSLLAAAALMRAQAAPAEEAPVA